jgi:uncharacterized DUF497 family protein
VRRVVEGQERRHTIGLAGGIALLLAVHTSRKEWRRKNPNHLR